MEKFPHVTYAMGQNMIATFDKYTFELEKFTNYNRSSLMSERSILLLNTIALLSELKDDPVKMLIEFFKALPEISSNLRRIVSSLSGSMGKLTVPINEAITGLERSLNKLLNEFLSNGVKNLARGKKTDFEHVIKAVQKLANVIASISKITMKHSELATIDVREAETILNLIFLHCLIMVQGTHITIGSLVYSSTKYLPRTIDSSIHSMDIWITGVIGSIVSIADSFQESVGNLLQTCVNLTTLFNTKLENLSGIVVGVTLSVEKIIENLSFGVTRISQGVTNVFN